MSAAVATPPPAQPAAPLIPVSAPPTLASATSGPPATVPTDQLWRLSVADYHKMLEVGIFHSGDPVELLDGLLVRKMPKNPPHVVACRRVNRALAAILPAGWLVWSQDPITLGDDSEPEPDLMLVRGTEEEFESTHPAPAAVQVVVEVSHTTLSRDRSRKGSIYARNGIFTYWIVNLVDHTLEVYAAPAAGMYTTARTLTAAEQADLVLDGVVVGTVAVADLFPASPG